MVVVLVTMEGPSSYRSGAGEFWGQPEGDYFLKPAKKGFMAWKLNLQLPSGSKLFLDKKKNFLGFKRLHLALQKDVKIPNTIFS